MERVAEYMGKDTLAVCFAAVLHGSCLNIVPGGEARFAIVRVNQCAVSQGVTTP